MNRKYHRKEYETERKELTETYMASVKAPEAHAEVCYCSTPSPAVSSLALRSLGMNTANANVICSLVSFSSSLLNASPPRTLSDFLLPLPPFLSLLLVPNFLTQHEPQNCVQPASALHKSGFDPRHPRIRRQIQRRSFEVNVRFWHPEVGILVEKI